MASPRASTSGSPVLVGIDFGTSSIKVVAFGLDGHQLELVRATTPTTLGKQGEVEYELSEVWASLITLLGQLMARLPTGCVPIAVAAASVGEAGVPVDRDGIPLRRAIAWNDGRSVAQADWWASEVGLDDIHRITGQTLDAHFGVNKLLWIRDNEPQVFRRTFRWLSIADWIILQLSGRFVTDPTLASRTMMFDQASGRWSDELLAIQNLSGELFPEVLPSGTAVGPISAAAASATGLPDGTLIVVGGHDRLCGAFASRRGIPRMIDSTGSAEALVLPTPTYVARGAREAGFVACYADVVPGNYVYSARVGYAGTLLDWVRTLQGEGARGRSDNSYEALMAEIPLPLSFSGLLAFPSFGRVVTPYWDHSDSPGFIAGLTLRHHRGHIAQALLEGISFSLRANSTWVEGLAEVDSTDLLVEGGATRNPIWMQLKADITGRTVSGVTLEEPTALGAALLAGVGAQVYPDHETAAATVAVPVTTWLPDADRSRVYEAVYEQAYRPAPALLRAINETLIALGKPITN